MIINVMQQEILQGVNVFFGDFDSAVKSYSGHHCVLAQGS